MGIADLVLVAVLVLVVVSTALAVRVVPAGHAGLVERLGRPHRTVGPGLTVMVPYAERLAHRVDLREQEVALLGEPLVDRDSLLHHLDVRVHHAVTDARAAMYAVADHRRALAELTRATLRRLVGELGTDEVAGHEAWVGRRVHEVLGEASDAWGLDVRRVEVALSQPTHG